MNLRMLLPLFLAFAVPSAAPAEAQEFSFTPAAGPGSAELGDAVLSARLGEFVDRLAAADLFSGAVLLAHGDEVLLDRAWGEASKAFHVPNRTTTRFNLASVSKMWTAILVAQLVEEGRLAYDQPVGRYLPDFPVRAVREHVTLHHLLTHTSGLGTLFDERWERSSRTLWRTVNDWMTLLADARLDFEPGTRYRYSNAGFLLLGAIVERVGGKPWDAQLEERVLRPAGMTRSGLFARDEPVEDMAEGYTKNRFGNRGGDGEFAGRWWSTVYTNPWLGSPAGGASSTTGDMLRFFQALDSGKLLPSKRVEELLRPRVATGEGSRQYGYGFLLEGSGEGASFGHDGDFWGVGAVARHDPRSGRTLVVLANYGDNAARQVAKHYDELVGAPGGAQANGFRFTEASELDPAERERLFHPSELNAAERERYARVALELVAAVNDEDEAAYAALMAPGFLAGLDDEDPWKGGFAGQLGSFGRIATAWAPRRGPLNAGGGARFAGHAGGVSVLVRFETAASGTLTFSLDDQDRITQGSCWFKRGFSEENVGADEKPIFELE